MKLSVYQYKQIRELLWICGISGLVGLIFSIGIHMLVLRNSPTTSLTQTLLLGTLTGILVSLCISLVDIPLRKSGRKPLWVEFFIVPMLYTVIIAVIYSALFICIMGFVYYQTNSYILITVIFSLLMTFCVNFMSAINRLLGQHVLPGLITGKYHHPVNEERFVLFLDLVGSTTTAEKIGNLSFHSFLNDFFCDLSKPVINLHGDIYKYVGDEVIITWTMARGAASEAAIRVFFDIQRVIAEKKAMYQARYGMVPEFRSGLHFGTVVVGEMGDYKQEIALLGDVMNTTARIQAECRNLSVNFLISEYAMAHVSPGKAPYTFTSCGSVELRGKERAIKLYSVTE